MSYWRWRLLGVVSNRGQFLRYVSNLKFILVFGVIYESILVGIILKNFRGNVLLVEFGMILMWIVVVKRQFGMELGCVNKKGMIFLKVVLDIIFKYEEVQCLVFVFMKKLYRSKFINFKIFLNVMCSW